MVAYALSKNETLAANTTKAKVLKHVECGKPLERVDTGQMFCARCLKTGWPVKAK